MLCDSSENLKLETFHTVVFTPANGKHKCCNLLFETLSETLFRHIFKTNIGGMENHSYPLSNVFQPLDESSDVPNKISFPKTSFYPIWQQGFRKWHVT